MRTLFAALTLSGATVLGVAQTNSDVVPPPGVSATNSTGPTVPLESTAIVAKDIRTVSGLKVNLGPVHDFERNPMGDRPLKHWKKISFQVVGPVAAGQSVCQIKVEGGADLTAVVKNVPQPIVDAYVKATRLADEQQKLSDQIAKDAKRITQNIEAANAGTLDAGLARNLQAEAAQLQTARSTLLKLNQETAQAQNYFASIATDYAMFTGTKARELEIWDCGMKVK